MDKNEQSAAANALFDWFKSQDIAPVEAAEIMHFMLYAILKELEEECKARSS
jgi:hypothetical protein